MRVKKVCRCKTCQKIYPNGIVEICNCGTILGEKIPKAERLSKMFIPGATITFKADFHSAAVKSFVGHYNYYVLTRELYDQVKEEIPDWVGVYIGDYCAKKAKKQDLSGREYKTRRSVNGRSTEVSTPWEDMLKESMIRSLYRDSDKLIQTEDEQYISRLRSQIDKARTERDRESKKYLRLWKAVRKEFGDEKAWELIEKAEE